MQRKTVSKESRGSVKAPQGAPKTPQAAAPPAKKPTAPRKESKGSTQDAATPAQAAVPPIKKPIAPKKESRSSVRAPQGASVVPSDKKAAAVTKDWHEIEKNVLIINGNYSQSHKRYKGHNEQSAAVCVVACAFSSMIPGYRWTRSTLDSIIEIGTNLHLKTKQISDNRCASHVDPPQVYKYFFLGDINVTMRMGVNVLNLKVPRSSSLPAQLEALVSKFFEKNNSGIFGCHHVHFAVWKMDKFYYIFDPLEHALDGSKWIGLPGLGFSYAIRATTFKQIADVIFKNIPITTVNNFTMYPYAVEKLVRINRVPPETVDGKPATSELEEKPKLRKSKLVPPPKPAVAKVPAPSAQASSTSVQQEQIEPKPSVSLSRMPPEKIRLKSVTNFVELLQGRIGILRASTHQNDPKFTRYLGAQSLGNAVAALTMLRQHKAKTWVRVVLDDVLKLGEVIHHDSKKLKPGEMVEKITCKDKEYTPKMERYGTVGRLQSDVDNILNLEQALRNFLIDNDCCILVGPLIVAIWKEDDRFYMFDPNERDEKGGVIKQADQSGVACVTWFTKLSDLIGLYMQNVPLAERNDRFLLSKVTIKDYQGKALDWFNFRALSVNKWILRGTFSQQDRRFSQESRNSQCTANATMALAFKELKPEKEWDTNTVNDVLMNGDQLYRNSVDYLKENNKFHDAYLMVDEVLRSYDIENKRLNFEIDDCLVNGVINAKSDTGILNLKRGFEEFFNTSEAGIVTANGQSMAIWKRDDVLFYFDSHSRSERGIVCGNGTACCLRMITIEDLSKALTTNLGANRQNFFNISRIIVRLIDLTEDGFVKPLLVNYEAISDLIAILRSNFSEKDPKFDLNAGKQTVPMCVAAIAMNALTPSFTWTKDDLDEVLAIGDKLYGASMEANYGADLPEELNVDEVSTNNVKTQLAIGQNSFQVTFDVLSEGTIENNLSEAIDNLYQFSQQQGFEGFQAILESEYMTASMWRDENLIYLFDPKPRDPQGQVYGKDDWSAKIEVYDPYDEIEVTFEDEEEAADEMGGGDNFGPIKEGDEEREKRIVKYDGSSVMTVPQGEEEEEGDEPEVVYQPPIEKKGSAHWRGLEDSDGKACVLRFSRIEDLINHVVENSPPNQRGDIQYSFKSIKFENNPVLHEVFDAENEEEKDEFMGDWHDFKEIDYGKWILRSVRNYTDVLFPECNRGRQQVAMCIVTLAFVYLYAISKFKQATLNDIIAYGDRFYTVLRRLREKELKSNKELKLSEEEIELILNGTIFKIPDYPKRLCMGEKRAIWEVELEKICGDITSKIPEEVPDVLTALTTLFTEHGYGILECRDYVVSVWKLDDIYYMFDPHGTGPSGFKSPLGVACITRFKELEHLTELFIKNLPHLGENFFQVHAFTFQKDECVRPRKPEVKEEKPVKMGGFAQVMAGKQILRGTLKLDCTKFDRGVHLHSPAIAFVALAISLAMEPETWTQILVNEVLAFGEELYNATLQKYGEKFNTWEDRLDIYRLNNDFTIGSMKANCTLRYTEQRGIVDVKNAKIPNLRQGLERFFQENSHGVLIAGKMTLAVWEEPKGDDINIYVYDPNSRGPTGLPAQGGVACVMKFCNSKTAADHIMATMIDMDKAKTNFAIVPVEVVVGAAKSKRKVCKPPKPSTMDKCIPKPLTANTIKEQPTIKPLLTKSLTKGASTLQSSTRGQLSKREPMKATALKPPSSVKRPSPVPSSTTLAKRGITVRPHALLTKSSIPQTAAASKPVTCPTKETMLAEKREMRRIAEEERRKQEAQKQAILGRKTWHQVSSGVLLLRGLRSCQKDRELPVNIAAFIFMKIASDLSTWSYKQIELILETGYQLYIDSFNAFKPPTTKLGLQHVLRRIVLKGLEVKIDIKKPVPCGSFTTNNLLNNLNKFFTLLNFCMLSYRDYLVSIYFKSGYYYLFDPYSRDIHGNNTADGCAVFMRFDNLATLVDKLIENFHESNGIHFALIIVAVQQVQPLSK